MRKKRFSNKKCLELKSKERCIKRVLMELVNLMYIRTNDSIGERFVLIVDIGFWRFREALSIHPSL